MRQFLAALAIFIIWAVPAWADDPLPGEIRLWAGTIDPPDTCWRYTNGDLLHPDTNHDLYDAIGYDYGQSGEYYRLPDIEGRVVVHQDTSYAGWDTMGETGGEISHTLTIAEMPSHNHTMHYNSGGVVGSSQYVLASQSNAANNASYGINVNDTGGGQKHNNLQPYIALKYIIYVCDSPAPTATPTPTPTPTPGAPITYTSSISVYTYTLGSGQTLTVPVQISLGQIMIAGLLLAVLTAFALRFIWGVNYG